MNLKQLDTYFSSVKLPESIWLNNWTFVSNVCKFVESNMCYLKANSGNKTFYPYYKQLVELINKIEQS